jgi:catechol 2,3-dioxygenase-like lactoylglutathione lyase family enzyme
MNTAAPALAGIDHVHVFVADRVKAVDWYRRVLGFEPLAEYASWAAGGGPLTIADASGRVHLALFERPTRPHRGTVALGTDAQEFAAWRERLARELPEPPTYEDHDLSVSIYFSDPDGNPYEITTCEHEALRGRRAGG